VVVVQDAGSSSEASSSSSNVAGQSDVRQVLKHKVRECAPKLPALPLSACAYSCVNVCDAWAV
jgi:hypothetical protein